jgi:hypothetical protein
MTVLPQNLNSIFSLSFTMLGQVENTKLIEIIRHIHGQGSVSIQLLGNLIEISF